MLTCLICKQKGKSNIKLSLCVDLYEFWHAINNINNIKGFGFHVLVSVVAVFQGRALLLL